MNICIVYIIYILYIYIYIYHIYDIYIYAYIYGRVALLAPVCAVCLCLCVGYPIRVLAEKHIMYHTSVKLTTCCNK